VSFFCPHFLDIHCHNPTLIAVGLPFSTHLPHTPPRGESTTPLQSPVPRQHWDAPAPAGNLCDRVSRDHRKHTPAVTRCNHLALHLHMNKPSQNTHYKTRVWKSGSYLPVDKNWTKAAAAAAAALTNDFGASRTSCVVAPAPLMVTVALTHPPSWD
jgi:hypothetical protein